MLQASNIHYFVGLTAISLLASSCSVDRNTTKIATAQDVVAIQKHSDKNSVSSAPEVAKSQPPKADLISVGVMANVRSDRAVKVDGIKTFDRIVASNPFATAIEGKGGKLIVVYITLKNTGNESGNMAWSRFRLEDKEGRKYTEIDDFMTKSLWVKEQGLDRDNEQIFPGGTAQTAKIFRVANDANKLKLAVNLTTFKLPSEDRNIQTQSDEGEGKSDLIRSNDDSNQSNDRELASNNSSISRKAALAIVKKYITAKSKLFAAPYDKNLGAELLTGKIYRDKIDKGGSDGDSECNNPDDCLSSIDWLIKYEGQYSYGNQRINSIDSFESNGDTATLTLTTTESRTLHKSGKKTRSGETSQSTFELVLEDGSIKISDIHNR
jgi:ARC6-like, IMS domain/Domain of unknown function (DUF4352)